MAAILHLVDQRRLIDSNGISDEAQIAFYLSGTTTPATIYADIGLTTPRANPVVVGSGAAVPVFYLNGAVSYRRVITYSDGSTDDNDPYTLPDYLVTAAAASVAADAARDEAVTARDIAVAAEAVITAALLNGDAYTDTTVAAAVTTGLADAAEGEYFIATGDDIDEVRQYQDVSGVATLIFALPTIEAVEAQATLVADAAATFTREYMFLLDATDDPPPGGVNLAVSIPAAGTISRIYATVEEGTGEAEIYLEVNGVEVFAPATVTDAVPLDEYPNEAVDAGDTITAYVLERDETVTLLRIKVEVSL